MKKKMGEHEAVKFAVLAADTVVFTMREGELLVRLVKVERPPYFPNSKGLPGGLLHPEEDAETAAKRHVGDKALLDISKLYVEQLYTFSRIDRDPRGRVVAVIYSAYVAWDHLTLDEQGSSKETWWATLKEAKKLAYDHDEVLAVARERLRTRARYTTLLSKLMPKEFTLTELETAYECVLGSALDKRNFRKKILKLGVLKETNKIRSGGRFRPAKLYQFVSKEVKEIELL